MSAFNLSFPDYAALAALLLTAVGSQYAITSAQIDASEARLTAALSIQGDTNTKAVSELSSKFDRMVLEISGIVEKGVAARSDEVMIALSSWLGSDDAFTVKVANIPLQSALYQGIFTMAQMDGSEAWIYTLDSSAIAGIRVKGFDDKNAISLRELLHQASDSVYDGIQVRFDLNAQG